MKKAIISLSCILAFCANIYCNPYRIDVSVPEQLIDQMYAFFTKTLNQHYQIADEKELYKHFLNDYFEAYLVTDPDSFLYFSLDVNKEEMRQINNGLFIRDFSHYYYFFPEVIIRHSEELKEADGSHLSKHTNVPTVVISPKMIRQDRKRFFTDYYDTHAVILVNNGGFLNDISGLGYNLTDYLINTISLSGEVSFFNLSALLVKTPASKELMHKKVREIIAVVFWKYLCLEAGLGFHVPG